MGHAEFRTSDFSPLGTADTARAPVIAIYPAYARPAAEPLSDVDPKARRIAALVFLGGVVGFWAATAATISMLVG